MPPNDTKPSETAMEAAKKVGHVSMEWTSDGTLLVNKETDDSVFADEAAIIDAAYALPVEALKEAIEYIDSTIDDWERSWRDPIYTLLPKLRTALARATPKGATDDAS